MVPFHCASLDPQCHGNSIVYFVIAGLVCVFEAYFFYIALVYYWDNARRDEFAVELYRRYTLEMAKAWTKSKQKKKAGGRNSTKGKGK